MTRIFQVPHKRQDGERAGRQKMLVRHIVVGFFVGDGADDGGLAIGPAGQGDIGLAAHKRAAAVGADHPGQDLLAGQVDLDDDGYISNLWNGNDCDDGNANVNPGAPEVCDGVDKVIPVDVYVPGCPPRPEMLIDAILKIHAKIMDEPLGPKRAAELAESGYRTPMVPSSVKYAPKHKQLGALKTTHTPDVPNYLEPGSQPKPAPNALAPGETLELPSLADAARGGDAT